MAYALAIIYVICFIINYSATLAYFQNEYPYIRSTRSVWLAIFEGFCGPVAIILIFIMSGFFKHGFQFLPKKPEKYPW